MVLLLKSLGINDLINFDFMDPPPTGARVLVVVVVLVLQGVGVGGWGAG